MCRGGYWSDWGGEECTVFFTNKNTAFQLSPIRIQKWSSPPIRIQKLCSLPISGMDVARREMFVFSDQIIRGGGGKGGVRGRVNGEGGALEGATM